MCMLYPFLIAVTSFGNKITPRTKSNHSESLTRRGLKAAAVALR